MSKAKSAFLLRFMPCVTLIASAAVTVPYAHASTNLLNAYIGAAYGKAQLRAGDSGLVSSLTGSRLGSFDARHSAYQIIVGARGLEFLGAEFDYFDLGSANASPAVSGVVATLGNAHISQKGEAAFVLLYLPVPVPVVDVYLKAGVARLTTDLSAAVVPTPGSLPLPCPTCLPFYEYKGAVRTTTTTFAAGAGVQWTFGNWAIRGEYE